MDLVVLAAGIGSRFGGLKQLKEVGPSGEVIVDYSIYDALKVGFDKVIFVVKKDTLNLFKEIIGSRISRFIKVEYAIQDNNYRKKPLGTAHAIMCAKKYIDDKFMVINADDFYGRESFKVGFDFLLNNNCYGLVVYKLENTLSINGKVKRGICSVENGYLKGIVESYAYKDDKIYFEPLSGGKFEALDDMIVSMNMLLLDRSIFKYIEKGFIEFLKNDFSSESEYLIPDVISNVIKNGYNKCKILKTDSKWFGVTYKEDLISFKDSLNKLIEKNEYPKKLWK